MNLYDILQFREIKNQADLTRLQQAPLSPETAVAQVAAMTETANNLAALGWPMGNLSTLLAYVTSNEIDVDVFAANMLQTAEMALNLMPSGERLMVLHQLRNWIDNLLEKESVINVQNINGDFTMFAVVEQPEPETEETELTVEESPEETQEAETVEQKSDDSGSDENVGERTTTPDE